MNLVSLIFYFDECVFHAAVFENSLDQNNNVLMVLGWGP